MIKPAAVMALVAAAGCEITSPESPIAAVAVLPTAATIDIGDTVRLRAVALNAAGESLPGGQVKWTSLDPMRASVSPEGLVVGHATGAVTVLAMMEDKVGATSVAVRLPAGTITLTPSTFTLVPTGEFRPIAVARDSAGAIIEGRTYRWSISDTAVAAIDSLGTITARIPGSAVITARSRETTAQATLTVRTVTFATLDVSEFGLVCAVTTDSTAFCWNSTDRDQGTGGITNGRTPVGIASQERFQLVTGGEAFACGLSVAGAAYCWGWNGAGRLGNGSGSSLNSSPVPTPVLGGLTFTTLSAGHSHSCGLTATGDAYCWGSNLFGALGIGTTDPYGLVPTLVTGGLKFLSISAGVYVTCGLAVDSTAYCWGFNYRGQLGTGDSANRLAPTPVSGGLKFRSLVTASEHSCGIATTGDAYCWGNNHYGELGTGDSTGSPVPVAVTGGVTFTSISPGGDHGWNDITCGLTAGGTAYCWGYGAEGTLGNGLTTGSPVPVQVSGGLTFGYLIAGSFATCGITTGTVTYCWGVNNAGRLGTIDTSAIVTAPSRVLGQP